MNKWNLALMITVLGLPVSSRAAVSMFDPFTDGDKAAGSDNSGIAFYDRSTNSVLSIAADAVIGSGNALRLDLSDNTVTNRGFTGVLGVGLISLATQGDYLDLKFDFRFLSTPGSSNSGLTFGFYNSNGSVITADGAAAQDNDFGFRADFGTGANSSISIFKEQNTTSSAGGAGTGTDGLSVALEPGFTNVQINDTGKHSARMLLTKSAAGLDILVQYDGATVATGTSTAPYLVFDEILFSQGSGTDFNIDNVDVSSNVPEPSSVLLAAGALSLLGLRRRR